MDLASGFLLDLHFVSANIVATSPKEERLGGSGSLWRHSLDDLFNRAAFDTLGLQEAKCG